MGAEQERTLGSPGPPVNSTVGDNAVPGAGYWTKKDGPNSAGSKEPGYQIYTKNSLPIQLFNMGHGNVASEAGSAETNVIGWDGYLKWEGQGVIEATTDCNMGIPHALRDVHSGYEHRCFARVD